MGLKRLVAGLIVAATGGGVAIPNALSIGTADLVSGVVLLVGVVLGVVLIAAGGLLYRSDVSTPHALRVAGWNALGVVVLGTVLLLATQYPGVSIPAPIAASVLGVSAVAHVLIGVNDVRRIRAGELAREREKLAVLNRLARHNLRNQAQVLTAAGDIVGNHVTDDRGADAAGRVQSAAQRIATINTKLKRYQEATEKRTVEGSVGLAAAVESAVAPYREEYLDADIAVDVPDVRVATSPDLEVALDELLENAFEHGDATAGVRVSGTVDGGEVALSISDGGPGIPDHEWEIVTGDREQSQLDHASGLGLWIVREVVETFDGRLERGDGTVTIYIPRA